MEKSNYSTPQRPEGERILDAPAVIINIYEYIAKIKSEQSWKDSDRNAIAVLKNARMEIVVIALHENAEMARQIIEHAISIQVLQGNLILQLEFESMEIKEGNIIALREKTYHTIQAKTEAVFLLTLSKKFH